MNRDTYAEQGFSQFLLNSTENLIQSCLRIISICLEMPGDAKNYIRFVVDKFCLCICTFSSKNQQPSNLPLSKRKEKLSR